MELLMYPMKTLRITQGYGFTVDGIDGTHTFSHAGQHALDQGGKDGGVDPIYAPASCIVKRITSSYNIVYFETLNKVYCADGTKDYMCWRFMHMSDANLAKLGIRVGKTFKQGEICYYEGNKGMGSTGTHLHMEVGRGKYTGTGSYNMNGHNSINNPVFAHKVMFVGKDVNIVKGMYTWKRVSASDYLAAGNSQTITPSIPSTPTTNNTAAGVITVGEIVNLKNKKLYVSSTGTAGYMKANAVYYIYDGKCVNGRYRVTNNGAKVNAGFQYVSGWVNAADVNGGTSTSTITGTTTSSSTGNAALVAGTRVVLNGKLYASSSSKFGFTKSNYMCYIFDGKLFNGKYRVCLLPSYVNKSAAYIAGYANSSNLTVK